MNVMQMITDSFESQPDPQPRRMQTPMDEITASFEDGVDELMAGPPVRFEPQGLGTWGQA